MSECESDDTDILLLIPPDYFLTSAQEKLQQEESNYRQQTELRRHLEATEERIRNLYAMDPEAAQAESLAPTTAAYRFLDKPKKAELNFINARLQNIEAMNAHERDGELEDDRERFAAPSDISTISTCTVRSRMNTRLRNGVLHHSTPKAGHSSQDKHNENVDDDGVLLEIDNFLEDHPQPRYCNLDWNQDQHNECHLNDAELEPLASSLPSRLNGLSMDRAPHVRFDSGIHAQQPRIEAQESRDHNLISLSEIWSKSGQNTAIAARVPNTTTSMSLQEEQLRRQHLEKTIHSLQTRLLEYQQRISVAMEVDRQKDSVLRNTQNLCKSLEEQVSRHRDTIEKLEKEHRESNVQKDLLQKELAQAVSLATKFQEKNEKLESQLNDITRKTNDCNNEYKTQLEELEVKLQGCKRSEDFALNELSKLKDKLAKTEYQSEKLKVRCEELEKENANLKRQKETLHDFHQKLKLRSDGLETQKKSLQEALTQATANEMALKKKIEVQQKSLKAHYQQQLENVVAQKLREFQEQLDKMEEKLKTEGRERERLIAERAVKQLELINEKNELEHNLLQEKHNEEVELYRIQLANASKKIDDLETKLNCYKSKRADIAEKLHNVMETQWQKALEILTSPSQFKSLDSNLGSDMESSPDNNIASIKKANETNKSKDTNDHENKLDFETPKTSKLHKSTPKKSNLNIANGAKGAVSDSEPIDRLQAYIELLLSKSPSDFDKLNEILLLAKKNKNANGKSERTTKRNISNHMKPPWKV